MDPNIYNQVFTAMFTAGDQMSGVLVSDGTNLAFGMFGLMLGYRFFQMAIGDGATPMAQLANDIFKLGVVLLLLSLWTTTVKTTFTDEFTNIAQKVTASQGSYDVVGTIGNTIKKIWFGNDHGDGADCTNVQFSETAGADGSDPTTNKTASDCNPKASKELPIWKAILVLPIAIGNFGLRILAIMILGVMMVVYMAQVNLGAVMTIIGLAVGPVLIPGYVIPRLSFLFDAWLKFMISAGLFKVVAAILSVLAEASVKVAMGVANQVVGDTADLMFIDLIAMLVICVIVAIATYYMMHVPTIATGLVSGDSGRGSQFTFGKMTSAATSMTSKK